MHYWLHPELLHLYPDTNILGNPIYTFLLAPFAAAPHILLIIGYIVTFLLALYFNQFLHKQRLLTIQNYYPALVVLTVSALLPEWIIPSMPMLSSFLAMLLLQRLIVLYRKEKMYGQVFDIGLIVGLGILSYTSLVWFAVLLLFALFILRAFVLREWINVYTGIVVPLFLTGTWYFYTDRWPGFYTALLHNCSFHSTVQFSLNKGALAAYGTIVVLCLYLWIMMQSKPLSRLVLVRKVFWLWFHLSWVIAVSYFFTPNRSATHFYLFILPFSFYLSYYLCVEKNKWLRTVSFMLLVAVIAFQFLTL